MAGIAFDFLAKAADINVDRPRRDKRSFLPNGIKQLIPGKNAAAMVRQVFQQTEFAHGGENVAALNLYRHRTDVNFEIAKSKRFRDRGILVQSTQHAANAGHQLPRAERLGNVIVAAQFQALDAVGFAGLGGEEDDGSCRKGWGLADVAAKFEALASR